MDSLQFLRDIGIIVVPIYTLLNLIMRIYGLRQRKDLTMLIIVIGIMDLLGLMKLIPISIVGRMSVA